jgi:hypothetical protein
MAISPDGLFPKTLSQIITCSVAMASVIMVALPLLASKKVAQIRLLTPYMRLLRRVAKLALVYIKYPGRLYL